MEIPKDLKKDFFALSGLFYVADTHFEMFFKNKKEQSQIAKKGLDKTFEYEINFESIEAYLNKRFKQRSSPKSESISTLIQELNASGYVTIKDLDDKLNKAFKKYPEDEIQRFLNRVGVVRHVLRDYDPDYLRVYEELVLKRKNEKKK